MICVAGCSTKLNHQAGKQDVHVVSEIRDARRKKKTAVVYHYFEKDEAYRDNLVFFLSAAILDEADYFIVISGECSVSLPNLTNVHYIHTINMNNDFGGYIKFVHEFFSINYNRYIFINSSVRGPFLPPWFDGNWIDVFTTRLKDDLHLVGSSINTLPETSPHSLEFSKEYGGHPPFSHIQTTAYALTREALVHLREIGFYDIDRKLSKLEVIVHYEVRLSREIIKKGWNIGPILPVYDEIDYRKASYKFDNFSSRAGDMLFGGSFFGRSLSPTEVLFIKVNRDMISPLDLASYTFTGLCKMSLELNKFPEGQSLLERSYNRAKELSGIKPHGKSLKSRLRSLARKIRP